MPARLLKADRLAVGRPFDSHPSQLAGADLGLSEEELTKQLSQILPGVVDKLTPQGRLPTMAELSETR
jgi:uncharacterized protein YidB (DUF937 family)